MRIHWWSESKRFLTVSTSVNIRYAAMNVRMFLEKKFNKNIMSLCSFFSKMHAIYQTDTFNLVLSRKPRPHTSHLNLSRASAKWNFLCFINAFLLADTFPQIVHLSGFWMCLESKKLNKSTEFFWLNLNCMGIFMGNTICETYRTLICSRIEFLLRDLKYDGKCSKNCEQ